MSTCWAGGVTGPRQQPHGSTVVADDNIMSFTNIMKRYYRKQNYHYDTKAQAPYLGFSTPHGPQHCTFVSYEDPQSLADKGSYVRERGLGGAIIWTINQGYLPDAPAGQRDPLMAAVRDAFLR